MSLWASSRSIGPGVKLDSALIGLYLVMGAVALMAYSPTLTKLIASYESGGPATAEFKELSGRSRMIGIILAVLVVAIIVLMVVKPSAV